LEFEVSIDGETLKARTPDHRLDIGTGIIGVADLMEEIARIYGYDRIPETRLASELPKQRDNRELELEERVRDQLVSLGLQEVATYRLTTPEREARRLPPLTPPDDKPYIRLANPIASDRDSLRHSLLASLLEVVERNSRQRSRISLFEIGPVFLASEAGVLPEEPLKLVVVLTGPRYLPGWQHPDHQNMDFYDMKGVVEGLLEGLHLEHVGFEPAEHPSYHPGKCAKVLVRDSRIGVIGELHPLVHERYDLPETPLLAAELDLDNLLAVIPAGTPVQSVSAFPPVLEDLALVVDDSLPAQAVADAIKTAGGRLVTEIRLFDVYRGEKIGKGKKSLAYSLTYQDPERTLTDQAASKIRQNIINYLEKELGARLRS
jgi:phenylalanyl-tRNA synthetase beta chain